MIATRTCRCGRLVARAALAGLAVAAALAPTGPPVAADVDSARVAAAAEVGPAGAADSDELTWAEIAAAVGVRTVAADYVIVVDTSTSMRQHQRYRTVAESLGRFLAALDPKDQVTLVTFDASARTVWQGPAGESTAALTAKLPATLSDTGTDIGAAIGEAVRVLGRARAPAIATVVLVTDGQHQPPPGSAYPDTSGPGWDRLREQVAALDKQALSAYALPLAGATGAALLRGVFPSAVVLDPAATDEVIPRLERPKQEVRRAKLEGLVRADLDQGVEVDWPAGLGALHAGENRLTLRLRATTAVVPLRVSDVALSFDHSELSARIDAAPVELAPGQQSTVSATVTWDPGPASWAAHRPVRVAARATLRARVDSPWRAAVAAQLGLGLRPGLRGADRAVAGSAELGRPVWWVLAGVVVLTAAVALAFQAWRRPRLFGQLMISLPDARAARAVVDLSGRRRVLSAAEIGETVRAQVRMVRTEAGTRLVIQCARSGNAPEIQVCLPDRSVEVGGVIFEWRPAGGLGDLARLVSLHVAPPVREGE